jgi:hypothetical protein
VHPERSLDTYLGLYLFYLCGGSFVIVMKSLLFSSIHVVEVLVAYGNMYSFVVRYEATEMHVRLL